MIQVPNHLLSSVSKGPNSSNSSRTLSSLPSSTTSSQPHHLQLQVSSINSLHPQHNSASSTNSNSLSSRADSHNKLRHPSQPSITSPRGSWTGPALPSAQTSSLQALNFSKLSFQCSPGPSPNGPSVPSAQAVPLRSPPPRRSTHPNLCNQTRTDFLELNSEALFLSQNGVRYRVGQKAFKIGLFLRNHF